MEITLLASMRVIEDKCDDRNDNQCVCKQVFIGNHLTTPFSGEAPSKPGYTPQGQFAMVTIGYFGETGYLFCVNLHAKNRGEAVSPRFLYCFAFSL